MDAGSLERVVIAPQSGQRRVLTFHDSRNERTATLRRAAPCGAAPPRHAEEVTAELAVSADGRVAHIPRRVGDTDLCTHLSATRKRIDPLEPIRNCSQRGGRSTSTIATTLASFTRFKEYHNDRTSCSTVMS